MNQFKKVSQSNSTDIFFLFFKSLFSNFTPDLTGLGQELDNQLILYFLMFSFMIRIKFVKLFSHQTFLQLNFNWFHSMTFQFIFYNINQILHKDVSIILNECINFYLLRKNFTYYIVHLPFSCTSHTLCTRPSLVRHIKVHEQISAFKNHFLIKLYQILKIGWNIIYY